MLTLAEIVVAIRGLLLLARFDARGFEYFDRSIQGFWRSFQVAVLVAPFYAISLSLALPHLNPTASWQKILIAAIAIYICGWFLYPVIVYEVCRAIGKSDEMIGYIAVYNWLTLLGVLAGFPLQVPELLGVWPHEVGVALELLIYLALLALSWFVARNSLRIGWLPAAGFVFIEVLITFIMGDVFRALIGSSET